MFSVGVFIVSSPSIILYFLESQIQLNISLEPIITIQNPNEPRIRLDILLSKLYKINQNKIKNINGKTMMYNSCAIVISNFGF